MGNYVFNSLRGCFPQVMHRFPVSPLDKSEGINYLKSRGYFDDSLQPDA